MPLLACASYLRATQRQKQSRQNDFCLFAVACLRFLTGALRNDKNNLDKTTFVFLPLLACASLRARYATTKTISTKLIFVFCRCLPALLTGALRNDKNNLYKTDFRFLSLLACASYLRATQRQKTISMPDERYAKAIKKLQKKFCLHSLTRLSHPKLIPSAKSFQAHPKFRRLLPPQHDSNFLQLIVFLPHFFLNVAFRTPVHSFHTT